MKKWVASMLLVAMMTAIGCGDTKKSTTKTTEKGAGGETTKTTETTEKK